MVIVIGAQVTVRGHQQPGVDRGRPPLVTLS
jgi:hypothetical protein